MKNVYLFALAVVLACASQSGPNAPGGTVVARTDRNIIADAEIQSVPSSNLYDLISKLRPNFLRSRGPMSLSSGSSGSDPSLQRKRPALWRHSLAAIARLDAGIGGSLLRRVECRLEIRDDQRERGDRGHHQTVGLTAACRVNLTLPASC